MAYCTNCGASLAGAGKYCASCGYKAPSGAAAQERVDPEMDRTAIMSAPGEGGEEVEDDMDGESFLSRRHMTREDRDGEGGEGVLVVPDSEDVPEHLKKEELMPARGYVPNCAECGKQGVDVCIFCEKGVCREHSRQMAIMVNSIPSSRVVAACKKCAEAHVGEVPTAPVAREADFLYAVKPYHEWGYVD